MTPQVWVRRGAAPGRGGHSLEAELRPAGWAWQVLSVGEGKGHRFASQAPWEAPAAAAPAEHMALLRVSLPTSDIQGPTFLF